MCNTSLQYRNYGQLVDPFALSTFHLLRTCNRLLLPPAELESYYAVAKDAMKNRLVSFHSDHNQPPLMGIPPPTDDSSDTEAELSAQIQSTPSFYDNCVTSTLESVPALQPFTFQNLGESLTSNAVSHVKAPSLSSFDYNIPAHIDFHSSQLRHGRSRPRSEKRPIPDEQKDDRYYERRKRNNEAAKKSRDARKLREDRTAVHARVLEEQNKLLNAEVMHLRAEIDALHQRFKDSF